MDNKMPELLTPADLAAIEARWSKATPGPYTVCEVLHYEQPGTGFAYVCCGGEALIGDDAAPALIEDAEFLAASWDDVRRLLAEVKRLREENCDG